jgi:uncharacterized membrane-anchored protein
MAVSRRAEPSGDLVIGRARVDRRTKDLVKRLQPGDIAVIDHQDLDRVAAEGLIGAGVGAVVNASESISGRYPNLGPLLLAAARIPLVDGVGTEVMDRIQEGQVVSVSGGNVLQGDLLVAEGTRHSIESLEERLELARQTIGAELERFAENTLEYLREERHLLVDNPEVPDPGIPLNGRHVLIVVRGAGYREDLALLRQVGYVHEQRPVLIGVDGGADALLEIGETPDIIIGDFDSVSEAALHKGARLIVHAYPGGDAPGAKRLDDLGLDYARFESAGTSEDIAMLLAFERGAELIVAVGTHTSMVDFLDKGRAGMASTFLVRMKVGPILVDARGVNQLYQTRVRKRDLVLLVIAALFTMVVVASITDTDNAFFEGLRLLYNSLVR